MARFHHIINRGIERKNVFKCDDDKHKFKDIKDYLAVKFSKK